ncbi:UNVERIFIED_ORG: hypothetical protein J3D58_003032 [Paenarthrobacter nicotinovorans]
MNDVLIGRKGTLHLRIEPGERSPGATSDYLLINANFEGLCARKRVYDVDGWSRLLSFFEELEASWRGWDGDKLFASLEGDFRLVAKHVGRIRFSIELNEFQRLDPWMAKGDFDLDPGEELTAAVEALRALLVGR